MSKQINVGYEYRSAFESVYKLINGGCFPDLKYKAESGVISDGTYNYVLSNKVGKTGDNG